MNIMDYKLKYYKYKRKTEQIGAGLLNDLFGFKKKNVTVIVTVPHSFCPSGSIVRECDLRAEDAAKIVLNNLTGTLLNDNVTTYFFTIFLADSLRTKEHDLNRENTRDTPRRRDILSTINMCIKNGHKVFVLDIHSFPNSTHSFGENIPQIVLLDYPTDSKAGRYLKNSLTVIDGAIDNDIVVSSIEAGAEAMLLEFNENGDYLTDSKIHEFSHVLAAYIKNNV